MIDQSNNPSLDAMTEVESTLAAIERIVRILGPLATEERQRVIQGALIVLREPVIGNASSLRGQSHEEMSSEPNSVPASARAWLRQNQISDSQIAHVFDFSDGVATIIASRVFGRNNSERTIKAYVLAGIAGLFSSGEATFEDKVARSLCETLGCYDGTNHSRYMKDKGNNFLGDKEKGWRLTAPGLKFGAQIVKELGGNS